MPRFNRPDLIKRFMAPIVETRKREVVVLKVLTRLNLLVADPEATVEALCVRREPEVVDLEYLRHFSSP